MNFTRPIYAASTHNVDVPVVNIEYFTRGVQTNMAAEF